MKRFKHLLMAVLVVLPMVACDDDETGVIAPPPPEVSGTITGTVTIDGAGAGGVAVTLTGAQAGSTTTSASGAFSFTDLPEGNYVIEISASSEVAYDRTSATAVISDQQTAVTVTFSGQTITTARIQGVVRTSDGPLPGVTVNLSGDGNAVRVTGVAGEYEFANLAAGDYTVSVSGFPQGVTFPNGTSQTVNGLAAGASAVRIFEGNPPPPPPPAGMIVGVVTIDGTGAQNITVTLSGADNDVTATDANGEFSFEDLENGAYNVTISGFAQNVLFGTTTEAVTLTDQNQGAALTFTGATATPATVSLQGITFFNGIAQIPVNPNNIFGNVTVTVEVDEGEEEVSQLEVFIVNNGRGIRERFINEIFQNALKADGEAGASFDVTQSVNTADFTHAAGVGATVRFPNDPNYTLEADVTTPNGTRTAILTEQDLIFANMDAFVAGVSATNTSVQVLGNTWYGGPPGLNINVYGIMFSERDLGSVTGIYTPAPGNNGTPYGNMTQPVIPAAKNATINFNNASFESFPTPPLFDQFAVSAATYANGDAFLKILWPGVDGILGTPDDVSTLGPDGIPGTFDEPLAGAQNGVIDTPPASPPVADDVVAINMVRGINTDTGNPNSGTLAHTVQNLVNYPTTLSACCNNQWYHDAVTFGIFNATSPTDGGTGVGTVTYTVGGQASGSFVGTDNLSSLPETIVNNAFSLTRRATDVIGNVDPTPALLAGDFGKENVSPTASVPGDGPDPAFTNQVINFDPAGPAQFWTNGAWFNVNDNASGFAPFPIRIERTSSTTVNPAPLPTDVGGNALVDFQADLATQGYQTWLARLFDESGNEGTNRGTFTNYNDVAPPIVTPGTWTIDYRGLGGTQVSFPSSVFEGQDLAFSTALAGFDLLAVDGVSDLWVPFGMENAGDGTPFTGTPVTGAAVAVNPGGTFIKSLEVIDQAGPPNQIFGNPVATNSVAITSHDHGGNVNAFTAESEITLPLFAVDAPPLDFLSRHTNIMQVTVTETAGNEDNGAVGIPAINDDPSSGVNAPGTFNVSVSVQVAPDNQPNPLTNYTFYVGLQDTNGINYVLGSFAGTSLVLREVDNFPFPNDRFWENINAGPFSVKRGTFTGGAFVSIFMVDPNGDAVAVIPAGINATIIN